MSIRDEMLTQDNAATDHPIYVVREDKPVVCDPDYHNPDGYWDGEDLEDNTIYDTDENLDKAVPLRYEKQWVTVCFTRKAAEGYIRRNAHNMRNPHIWVASLYRNYEMQDIRRMLMHEDQDSIAKFFEDRDQGKATDETAYDGVFFAADDLPADAVGELTDEACAELMIRLIRYFHIRDLNYREAIDERMKDYRDGHA